MIANVSEPSSLTVTTGRAQAPGRNGPLDAAGRINTAYEKAMEAAENAVFKALYCGQLLNEQRELLTTGRQNNQHTAAADRFLPWLEKHCPRIQPRTAYRWMEAAERILDFVKPPRALLSNEALPLSAILISEPGQLPEPAREWRQTLFDFTAHKTMKEALAGVLVEGDDPHRITRAHNGRTKGGAGGNRKDFVKFSKNKLQHLTTFLSHELEAGEQTKIGAAFQASLQKWPRWLLKVIHETSRDELKLSDADRATRC